MAGCWEEGGVVWLAAVPGETVRRLVRSDSRRVPPPEMLLDHLERLWSLPMTGPIAQVGVPKDTLGDSA
jgi:hypothetical protein